MIVEIGDCLPLALDWELFDFVHTLATSMNSEDHLAVLPLLRSLVALLRNGSFQNELCEYKNRDAPHSTGHRDPSLQQLINMSNGVIHTKWALLGHLKYYLHYLYAVSPTEGQILMEANSLLKTVEKRLSGESESSSGQSSGEPVDMEVDSKPKSPAPSPTGRPPLHPEPECVLCKYNVPGMSVWRVQRALGLSSSFPDVFAVCVYPKQGHIHPGRDGGAAKKISVRAAPFHTTTSKTAGGKPIQTLTRIRHTSLTFVILARGIRRCILRH